MELQSFSNGFSENQTKGRPNLQNFISSEPAKKLLGIKINSKLDF